MDFKLVSLYKFEPSKEPVTRHDLTEIEHLMVKLAKGFEAVLYMSDILVGHDLDKLAAETSEISLRAALQRPRARVAKMICENYLAGSMPLITDIIYTKFPSLSIGKVQSLRPFDVKAADRAALDAMWSESAPLIPSSTTKRGREDAVQEMPPIWPPPIPEIRNEQLRLQVFTHRSAAANVDSSIERRSLNNERLEFRGDMLLGFVIVKLIYTRFADAEEGELSKIKSRLVSNALLVEFTHAYQLTDQLKCSASVRSSIAANPEIKFVADLFEAYVCGVEMDQGYQVMAKWLEDLYEPLIQAELSGSARELDKNAKTELYRLIGSNEQKVEYVATKINAEKFQVNCVVNGEIIGRGVGKSKKEAGLQAADMAIKNTNAIKRLSEARHQAALEVKEQRKVENDMGLSESGSSDVTPRVTPEPRVKRMAPDPSLNDHTTFDLEVD